jgi:hypothetical protein
MYTCGHLIYGTPPTEEIIQLIDKAAADLENKKKISRETISKTIKFFYCRYGSVRC